MRCKYHNVHETPEPSCRFCEPKPLVINPIVNDVKAPVVITIKAFLIKSSFNGLTCKPP